MKIIIWRFAMNRKSLIPIGLLILTLLLGGCFGKIVQLNISIQGQGLVTKSPDDGGKGFKKMR